MDEQMMFAAIGRKQLEMDGLALEYDRVLLVLSRVASGELDRDLVTVNLQARSWAVGAPEKTPVEPVEEQSC